MRIGDFCGRAAGSGAEWIAIPAPTGRLGGASPRAVQGPPSTRSPLLTAALAFVLATTLAACGSGPAAPGGSEAGSAQGQPPRAALPFSEAVATLTDALIARVDLQPGARRPVVIDPLIERSTGFQTKATRSIGAGMASRIRSRWPQLDYEPFSTASLAQEPLILLGSIAGVTEAGSTQASTGRPPVYRIWAVIADLRTNRVIDRQMTWVRADEIDQTPTAFFRDSPVWTTDPLAVAYIKTCSSTGGTLIDPNYRRALQAQALIADAIVDYDAGRYDAAQARYRAVLADPGGEQLRALNGVYLTDWALGRRGAAEQDFGRVVDYGLGQGRLAVKFVFRPGSTAFWPDRAISGAYPMWIRQIARRADVGGACLALTGHTSATGSPEGNERLSLARAERVRRGLAADRPAMRARTVAQGVGAREPIVGTGADDATDALDRRVEVRPISQANCAA